jgi:hypothetical protein
MGVTVVVAVDNVAMALAAEVAEENAAMELTAAVAEENAAMVPVVVVADINKPKLADGLLHFEKAGKHLFFAPDIPNWIVVNKNSALLLFSCDGTMSEADIFSSFDLQAQMREDAQTLFGEALKRGVLQEERSEKHVTADTTCSCSTDVRKGSLRSVYLKLTDECNLRCKYWTCPALVDG